MLVLVGLSRHIGLPHVGARQDGGRCARGCQRVTWAGRVRKMASFLKPVSHQSRKQQSTDNQTDKNERHPILGPVNIIKSVLLENIQSFCTNFSALFFKDFSITGCLPLCISILPSSSITGIGRQREKERDGRTDGRTTDK